MNPPRSRGTANSETCSAEIVVPAMTRMSRPPSTAAGTSSAAAAGVTAPQATAPAAAISATRLATSPGCTGSA